MSKRISVPENFSYFPAGPVSAASVSLQTQLAHHRLAQKRASLVKQRGPVTGDPRDPGLASRRDMRPGLRPGQVWHKTPPIAEDEPVVDSPRGDQEAGALAWQGLPSHMESCRVSDAPWGHQS